MSTTLNQYGGAERYKHEFAPRLSSQFSNNDEDVAVEALSTPDSIHEAVVGEPWFQVSVYKTILYMHQYLLVYRIQGLTSFVAVPTANSLDRCCWYVWNLLFSSHMCN